MLYNCYKNKIQEFIKLKSTDDENFDSFEELEKYYRKNLPAGVENIRKKISYILDSEITAGKLSDVRMDVHKLAGSVGTFGYTELNKILKSLDNYLYRAVEDNLSSEKIDTKYIKDSMDSLSKLLQIDNSTNTRDFTDFPVLHGKIFEKIPLDWNKSILLFSLSDKKYLDEIESQLVSFGYRVNIYNDLDKLQMQLVKKENYLILADIDSVIDNPENIEIFSEIKRNLSPLKIIYLSEKSDFNTRITGVKAGGDAFFELPLDVVKLVDKIYCFEESSIKKPDHVLIVDDDVDAISYYAHLFQQNGMITSVASSPSSVLDLLIESTPDLIMIDLFMPGCNGFELAAMIRQNANFVSIPILILSSFDSPGEFLKNFNIVGDDFLNKSVDDSYLLNFVKNKILRSRDLRYLMERDSLTGLLNHSNFNDSLYREIIRADRTDSQLVYAMIDLDHFKSVNDKYGHLTGDTVLKSLAYLLQKRLRKTDVLGRYGGEEFGILLTNTTKDDAGKVMDEIRKRFSRIKQSSDISEFFVTFSCGIASFPENSKAETLIASADNALYKAKESGRNCVVIADSESSFRKLGND